MKAENKQLIEELVDALETEYGELKGIEIVIDKEEPNETFSTIKKVLLHYIHKDDVWEK
jgi:hypothetical protein